MAFFSPATKEITAKIVYYGPGMCGKTTNLQKVHELMRPQTKGDLLSVATETDRTIYFDFLPLKLGKIAGFDFVVRVFTVPGQPYYAETRRIVLQGADGIVFVADSQRFMLDQNRDALLDLKKNLRINGLDYDNMPLVLQYNKRDLADVSSIADLDAALNDRKIKTFEASAFSGINVVETLKYVTLQVFRHVRDGSRKGQIGSKPRAAKQPSASKAAPAPAPTAPLVSPAPLQAPAPITHPGPVFSQNQADPFAHARQAPAMETSVPAAAIPSPSAARNAAPRANNSASTPLSDLVGKMASGVGQKEVPMPSRDGLAAQEFSNLLVLHHKLVERVAGLEAEIQRIKGDNRDIKALLGKRLQR